MFRKLLKHRQSYQHLHICWVKETLIFGAMIWMKQGRLEEEKLLWPAKPDTYHCKSPACCKTRRHSCSHSCPLSALGRGLCRPSSASLWDPSRPHRTRGRLQEQKTVERTSCHSSSKALEFTTRIFTPSLCTYLHHRRKKTPPQKKENPISVGQKYNFHKLLLRELEQEIKGYWVMGITGKGIIISRQLWSV